MQQRHLLLLFSLSCLISSLSALHQHALLLNAEPFAPKSSKFCLANQTKSCSSGKVNISFPFFPLDECHDTASSFGIANCESRGAKPEWPSFTKSATKADNGLNSTVTDLYIPDLSTAAEESGSANRTFDPRFDPRYGYINLTWSAHRSKNVCDSLVSSEQISNYIPQSIDLQSFEHSAFKFDRSNIILLFRCNPALAVETSPFLNMSSTACVNYERVCKQSKDPSYNCYQYLMSNTNKKLELPRLLNSSGCKQVMFFVALNSSLSASDWKPGLMRLNWSVIGTDQLASVFRTCAGCSFTNGSCGYDNLGNFQCFCDNRHTSTNCSENMPNDVAVSPTPLAAASQSGLIAPTPSTAPSQPDNRTRRIIIIVAGILVMAVFMILALLVMFCFCKRKKADTKADLPCSTQHNNKYWMKRPSFLSRKYDPIRAKEISYEELVHATETFADKNILGDGGFGAVYRGVLENGVKVAVKRLHHDDYRRIEHFYNELKVLSNLDHPNLVKLFGFCTCEDEKELLLVFEYASQGTIADHLHGGLKPPMQWSLRLSIACETADALSYLHNAVDPPIYHRDVKTANILLDSGFHAKLGDFGLSKLVPLKASHISTSPQGTPGYLDPEYHQCYQLTDKSDVYSLGVVLMELISGKLAVDMSRERGEINLSTLAVTKIQCGLLEELVDPKLKMKTDPNLERSIKRVVELAFECLHACREDRPSVKCVAETLAHIRREHEEATQKKDLSSPASVLFSSDSSSNSSS